MWPREDTLCLCGHLVEPSSIEIQIETLSIQELLCCKSPTCSVQISRLITDDSPSHWIVADRELMGCYLHWYDGAAPEKVAGRYGAAPVTLEVSGNKGGWLLPRYAHVHTHDLMIIHS